MLNHLGPGSLIAGVWFTAALTKLWPAAPSAATARLRPQMWLRVGVSVALVGLLFKGLGMVRVPVQPLTNDFHRYMKDIESEFEGQPADRILLDSGTWIYLRDGMLMKDRVTSIGDRGYGDCGDFSGIIQRLKQKRYSKILVRKLHAPDFWYDHWMWRKSSDIRRTLLENYREVARIKGVEGDQRYLFSEINVLVPNPE
jgi:hypothetical protein